MKILRLISNYRKTINRVPEDSTPKSVVIDRDTYHRLLKSCQVKTKERIETEKGQKEDSTNQLLV